MENFVFFVQCETEDGRLFDGGWRFLFKEIRFLK